MNYIHYDYLIRLLDDETEFLTNIFGLIDGYGYQPNNNHPYYNKDTLIQIIIGEDKLPKFMEICRKNYPRCIHIITNNDKQIVKMVNMNFLFNILLLTECSNQKYSFITE